MRAENNGLHYLMPKLFAFYFSREFIINFSIYSVYIKKLMMNSHEKSDNFGGVEAKVNFFG